MTKLTSPPSPESPLTSSFDARGWAHLPRLLDGESVARLHALLVSRLDALRIAFADWAGAPMPDFASYPAHQRALEMYLARGLPTAFRHFLRGEYDLDTRLSPLLADVLSSSSFRHGMAAFLGTERFYVHWPSMMRFKLAGAKSSVVPPHQDWTYNAHLEDFVTVWIPLVDLSEACGGVIVYEGSHHDGRKPHEAQGAWDYAAIADISPYRAHHFIAKAGDALLFPPTELHASAPHSADTPRFSLDVRVFLDPEKTAKSYFDPYAKVVTRKGP